MAFPVHFQRLFTRICGSSFGLTLLACAILSPELLMPKAFAAELIDPTGARSTTKPSSEWSARGGTLSVSFNTDLLREIGISLGADRLANSQELSTIPLSVNDSATLTFNAPHGNFENFIGGPLTATRRLDFPLNCHSKRRVAVSGPF